MTIKSNDRKSFLYAIIEYAEESGTFNPYFFRKEILNRLGIDEKTFNILQANLGPLYCQYVDIQNGDMRYSTNRDECYKLKDKFENAKIEAQRHSQLIWVTFSAAILGSIIGSIISFFRINEISRGGHDILLF